MTWHTGDARKVPQLLATSWNLIPSVTLIPDLPAPCTMMNGDSTSASTGAPPPRGVIRILGILPHLPTGSRLTGQAEKALGPYSLPMSGLATPQPFIRGFLLF